jgi:hypothetical protein
VENKLQDLSMLQNSLDSKKKELLDSSNAVKKDLASAFEEIRIRLQKKEKDLMDRADSFLQEHLQELNTYSRVINTKVISLNRIIDNIHTHRIRNDEVSMLNFYSENNNKIVQVSESELPEIPDLNTLYSLKTNIDTSNLQEMVNSLNGIHAEITSLKGFDIQKNNLNHSQKYVMRREMYGVKPHTQTKIDSSSNNNSFNYNINSNINKNFSNTISNFVNKNQNYNNNNTLNESYDYSKNNLVKL